MSKHYLAAVHLKSVTALPADDAINTLSFSGPDTPSDTDYTNLAADIANFWNGHPTGSATGFHVADYISGDVTRASNGCAIEFYERPSTPGDMGSPTSTKTFTLATSGLTGQYGVNYPAGVSTVLSFHATLSGFSEESAGTRPKARRRGRIYVGPLKAGAGIQDAPTGAEQTVSSTLMTGAGLAAKQYLITAALGHGWTWEVFSKVLYTGAAVVGGFMDDRFDYQRRRAIEADSRVLWS